MKKYLKLLLIAAAVALLPYSADAQYYQIANQLTGLIRPALTGGSGYKGFVDASYVAGLGDKRVDFAGISTSQGYQYRSWFYMGVGLGVDIAMGKTNPGFGPGTAAGSGYWSHAYKKTAVMIPLFTNFRFTIGSGTPASFYIDARIGASFMMGNSYLAVADGFITSREYFYLKPSLGARIPVGKGGRQAVDIGVAYQLLTTNYWYNSPYNATLSSLGAVISFEW